MRRISFQYKSFLSLLSFRTSRLAQRRARHTFPDRVQHGCCTRAPREGFTACLGMRAGVVAFEKSTRLKCSYWKVEIGYGDLLPGRAVHTSVYARVQLPLSTRSER